MNRHEEIKASYQALGGGFASLYDGIITRSTPIGKLMDSLVWGLDASLAAKWIDDALAPIPEDFKACSFRLCRICCRLRQAQCFMWSWRS